MEVGNLSRMLTKHNNNECELLLLLLRGLNIYDHLKQQNTNSCSNVTTNMIQTVTSQKLWDPCTLQ